MESHYILTHLYIFLFLSAAHPHITKYYAYMSMRLPPAEFIREAHALTPKLYVRESSLPAVENRNPMSGLTFPVQNSGSDSTKLWVEGARYTATFCAGRVHSSFERGLCRLHSSSNGQRIRPPAPASLCQFQVETA